MLTTVFTVKERFKPDCPPDGVVYPGETSCIRVLQAMPLFCSAECKYCCATEWFHFLQNVAIFFLCGAEMDTSYVYIGYW